MSKNVVVLETYRKPNKAAKVEEAEMLDFLLSLPLHFTREHCAQSRSMLDWSVEALAFRSGVSVRAIQQFENGERELLRVSLQALSYSLEAQGLIFIQNQPPLRADNCRGATPDPRSRSDYHLLE
ncbi:helix-turn-helix domain-containing protein [Pseudomonas violetae]